MAWLGTVSRGWRSPVPASLAFGALTLFSLSTPNAGQAPAPAGFRGLPLEASGVVGVPGSHGVLIVADGSEREVFWMEIDEQGRGLPVTPVAVAARVADPEDITTDGTYVYVVGSQSRGGGKNADGLIRFRFDPASRKASQVEKVTGLEAVLEERVTDLRRLSRGRSGPLNIEGMTWDQARARLLFGLRSPMLDGRALFVAARVGDASRPLSASNLAVESTLIPLDLGGMAVRGLGYDASTNRVLIIGGGSTDEGKGPFRLFDWDGTPGSSARDLGPLRSEEKPEGVTRVTIGGRTRTLVVFDLGGYQVID